MINGNILFLILNSNHSNNQFYLKMIQILRLWKWIWNKERKRESKIPKKLKN